MRERNARAQEHGGSHTPPPRTPEREHKQPGMENKTAKNRHQRKKRNSMNKQEGRQKPRRRKDREGKGRDTRHTTNPAHTNT